MASKTISGFAAGSTVSAYTQASQLPSSGLHEPLPSGTPVASVTADSSGVAAFSGLADATAYVASDGVSRRRFHTDDAASSSGSSGGTSLVATDARLTGRGPALATPVWSVNNRIKVLAPNLSGGVQTSHNALPGAEVMDNGTAIAVWRAGPGHLGRGILQMRFNPTPLDPEAWTPTQTLLDIATRDLRDVGVSVVPAGQAHAGRVVVSYCFANPVGSVPMPNSTGIIWSDDHGQTWTPHREDYIFGSYTNYARSISPVVFLADGSALLPLKANNNGTTYRDMLVLKSATGGLDPASWAVVSTFVSDQTTTDYDEPFISKPLGDGSLLLGWRDNINSLVRFKRSTDGGVTWTTQAGTVAGMARPTMYVDPDDNYSVTVYTRRPTGERPVWYRTTDKAVTFQGTTGNSATEGRTIDARWETHPDTGVVDSTTPVRMLYCAVFRAGDGVLGLVQGVEQSAGCELSYRFILTKPGVSLLGDVAGGVHVANGGLTIHHPTGSAQSFYTEASGRVLVRPTSGGLPITEPESAGVYLNLDHKRLPFLTDPFTVSAVPNASTEINGSRSYNDFTGVKEYIFTAATITGLAGVTIKVEYTLDLTGAAGWASFTATGISAASAAPVRRIPSTTVNGVPDWTPITSAARTLCLTRLVTIGGDGVGSISVAQIALLLRQIA